MAANRPSALPCVVAAQLSNGSAPLPRRLQVLDDAIERACAGGVSAKYGKKVRKKVQQHLNELRGIEPPENAAAVAAAATAAETAAAGHRQQLERAAAAAGAAAAASRAAAEAQQQRRQQQQNGHSGGAGSPSTAPHSPAKYAPPALKAPSSVPAAAQRPLPPGFAPAQQPQPQGRVPPASAKPAYNPLAAAQQQRQQPEAVAQQAQQAALPRPAWGQVAPPASAAVQQAQQAQQYATGGGSLFAALSPASLGPAPTSLFAAPPLSPAAGAPTAQPQPPLLSATAPATSLFAAPPTASPAAGPSTGGSLFGSEPDVRPVTSHQPAFASLAAFSARGAAAPAALPAVSSAGASLASQFADLDIGELQKAGYESFAAGGEALLSRDLSAAAAPFSPAGVGGGGGLGSLLPHAAAAPAATAPMQPGALDAGAELLSRDLLGEIDGVPPQHSGGGVLGLADAGTGSLFGPPTAPAVSDSPSNAAASSFSALRSLW